MLNEKKKKSEGLDDYDPDLDLATYGEFDFAGAIRGNSKEMRDEIRKIGWEGVQQRLVREYGQDINDLMHYCPPKNNLGN